MKNILIIGASSSTKSINKQLATYAGEQLQNVSLNILDLNDFEMPIYSIDKEGASGIPQLAQDFKQHILDSDGIIISFAEHNGSYSAAFKNIYDWVSRIAKKAWEDRPMILMATSPGGRGGIGVLSTAYNSFKFANPNVVGKFSLPSFGQNFDPQEGITNEELKSELLSLLQEFSSQVGL